MSTYQELQAQIQQLQHQAAALLSAERNQVIANVRAQIVQYGLTARDLGLAGGVAVVKVKAAAPARFRSANGEEWSGRGRQPQWFKDALAAGKTDTELRIVL